MPSACSRFRRDGIRALRLQPALPLGFLPCPEASTAPNPGQASHTPVSPEFEGRQTHSPVPPCTLLCLHTACAPLVGSQAQSCLAVRLRHGGGRLFRPGWVAMSAKWTYVTDYQPKRTQGPRGGVSSGLTSHSSMQLPCAGLMCLPSHHGIGLPPLPQESSQGKLELPGKNLTLPGLGPT